jgi:putative thioredoxin
MTIDVTDAEFQTEVVDRSQATPVVVDLWAPWCGPCRQLGPILERVVGETEGKVVLAKVNVDENPQISAAFRVQGIPAVYALAQPEPAVREFVSRLAPSPEDEKLSELLEAGDEMSLRAALDERPDHHDAIVALAELLARRGDEGDAEEAEALLARIPETAETRRVGALVRTGAQGESSDEITAKLDGLLDRVKEDDAARQEFVDLLDVLGPEDPRTAGYRKQLSARLF